MNVQRLNGSARAARINAERNTAEMEAIYASLIAQAAREAAAAFTTSTQVTAMAAAGWIVPPQGILLNTEALAAKATKALRKTHERIVRQSAAPMLARAGISWTITHPLVQSLLDLAGARTGERLSNTVQPVLQEIVSGAFQEGLPVRDTALLIREKIEQVTPGQAQMLARTDLNSLNNGGSVMAAQIVGVPFKQWLTAEDDRVRETHVEADGQTVPIDQPFVVGGEELDYPGDPGGSDEEVCNCRCTVIYVEGGEAEATAASGNPSARVSFARMGATRQRIPGRGFAAAVDAPPISEPAMTVTPGTRWEAVLAVEGEPTEDGRLLEPGSVSWRDLPLSLMAQTETQPGHDGAEIAGKIERIWRDGNNIRGAGFFNAGEFGSMIGELVREQTLRGVSVDLAPKEFEVRVVATDEPADPDEEYAAGDVLYVITDGVILGATVCAFQAIERATITVVAATNNGLWMLRRDGAWTLPGPSLDDRLNDARDTLLRTAELASARDDAERRASDMERLVASGTFAHMSDMQRRLEEEQARTAQLAKLVTDMQENHQTDTEAHKVETLALMASLTDRIVKGEQIGEAMLEAIQELSSTRKPRTVNVIRGEDGRPSAYEVA